MAEDCTDLTCSYCRTGSIAVTPAPCTRKAGCERRAIMCERCVGLHGVRVCDRCWKTEWGSECFACRGALPTVQTWLGRCCRGCFLTKFGGEDDEAPAANDLRCFYCRADAADVATRACARTDGCSGHVNVCIRCATLHGKVMCSVVSGDERRHRFREILRQMQQEVFSGGASGHAARRSGRFRSQAER